MIRSLLRHFSNCLKILTQILKPLDKHIQLFFLQKYSKSVFWTVDCRWNGTRNSTLSVWESQASEYLTKMFPSWLYIWTKHENQCRLPNYGESFHKLCKMKRWTLQMIRTYKFFYRMVHLQWRRKKRTLSHVQLLLSIHWKSPWIDLM